MTIVERLDEAGDEAGELATALEAAGLPELATRADRLADDLLGLYLDVAKALARNERAAELC
jgi:hypothetical protein